MDRYGEESQIPRARSESLGVSDSFVSFQRHLSQVAKVDRPLLIVGERGTGKELAVQRLHFLSSRWEGPLVALNCAALNKNVIESELFGHEAGSFTGASNRRRGRFESADRGTLFLDEVGLLPMPVQEKLLRVVEYGSFERVGGNEPVEVDVRIVGATNADLPRLAREGKFMRDLLDRLSFDVLFLPPLRKRREDITLLAQHFANRMSTELNRGGVFDFAPDALVELEAYGWPGNIRELKNVVERAVYRSGSNLIEAVDLVFDPFASFEAMPSVAGADKKTERGKLDGEMPVVLPDDRDWVGRQSFAEMQQNLELYALRSALRKSENHQGRAADLLGMTYNQFRGLYRKHGRSASKV